jgi:DASS family divalent anion:Na+ symporter
MNKQLLKITICFVIGAIIWFIPHPEGIANNAWQLLAIFSSTICMILLQALPMGAATLTGLTCTVLTKTMSFDVAFSGYKSAVPWLILIAFFIAHGFIKTGLGARVAYKFITHFGKRTLGLAYGLMLTDLTLAPVIPSLTARTGGVIFPIVKSLAEAFDSSPEKGTSRKIGSYLILCSFQCTVISASMFLTAMAANPLVANLGAQVGAVITWGNWALAASVPGALCLILIPFILFKIYPPELKETPGAVEMANKKLDEMGSITRDEIVMAIGFVFILGLWIFGKQVGISAATAALMGLCFLLFSSVLTWAELLRIPGAWDTFIWFGALIAMANGLNSFGLTTWFGNFIASKFDNVPWYTGFLSMLLIYFYIHYFFASSVAHVGALYLPLVTVAVKLGAPAFATALAFGIASNVYGSLTHYGCGPAPILYGSKYVTLKEWWGYGFFMSLINLSIWIGVGGVWWRYLGHI